MMKPILTPCTILVGLELGFVPAVHGDICTEAVSKLLAADGAAGDNFAETVAVSGDTAVFGARDEDGIASNTGSAYVFVRSDNAWVQQQKLTASDATIWDEFGSSVAISGDTIVVGAHYDDDLGSFSGSAYIFVRSGGVWTQQQKITAADGSADDRFGGAVAIEGDTAVVTAQLDASLGTNSGSAYVFVRSGGVWTQQQKITALGGDANDFFGESAAISGETVIVSAHRDNVVGGNTGSAHVFVRSGGVWTHHQKLIAADAAMWDYFGSSVSIDGDTIIIGAYGDDDLGTSSGSAYVFTRTRGTWTQQQKLNSSDGNAHDYFGRGVCIHGDLAVIGAYNEGISTGLPGAAYVFTLVDGVWTEQQKLAAADGADLDTFGKSVAISNDTVIVGAHRDDDLGSNSGSAHAFSCATAAPADVNEDGHVGIADLLAVIGAWGACPTKPEPCPADINNDGQVGIADLLTVIGAWGS